MTFKPLSVTARTSLALQAARRALPFPACHETPMTYSEAVAQAEADFARYHGRLVRPRWVAWPEGDASDPGLVCRVMPAGAGDLEHDTGTHLDPFWNLRVVSDPEGVCRSESIVWTIGPSIPLKGGDA